MFAFVCEYVSLCIFSDCIVLSITSLLYFLIFILALLIISFRLELVSVKIDGTRFLACIFRFGELCVIHLLHYLTLNCFDTAIVEFYMMSVHTIELNGYRTIHTNILSISGNFNCLRFSFGSFVYTFSSHAPFFLSHTFMELATSIYSH